jgi:hypothetical protein
MEEEQQQQLQFARHHWDNHLREGCGSSSSAKLMTVAHAGGSGKRHPIESAL